MTSPDITIVLNAHREGALLSYTLQSLVDTALHAATKGLSVELVAVLDGPDAATREALDGFETGAFVRIETLEVAHRSLGLSRNAGLAAARGAFTATVDGDDVYSFNYLAAMHVAATSGGLVLAVPEIVAWFDADTTVQRFEPLSRTGRSRLLGAHTFISCVMAPTSFLRDLGYRDCTGSRAYAYEDYDLNCRAVAAGADIRAAEDAALFYRRRAGSIMAAIGDATRRIVPPSAFFHPKAVVAAGDGDGVIEDGETLRPGLLALRGSHRLAELVAHVGAIEPRIDLTELRQARVWSNAMFDRGFGAAYHATCARLGDARFGTVLVVVSLAAAPDWVTRIAEGLRGCLIVETAAASSAEVVLPEASQVVTLVELPEARRAEMIVRLVHAFAADAALHVVLGGDGDALLGGLAEALERNAVVVYDPEADGGRLSTLPPDAAASIDLAVCGTGSTRDTLISRLPVLAGKLVGLPELRSAADAAHWFATIAPRLAPRPKETRWTTT